MSKELTDNELQQVKRDINDAIEYSEKMQWVDVKDRLPKFVIRNTTSKKVIICFDGFVTVGYLYKEYPEIGKNVWVTVDDTFDEEFVNVTHWMPLPEKQK